MIVLTRFYVKFKSRCVSCQDIINEGEKAAYSKAEPGQILCDECATMEEEERRDHV